METNGTAPLHSISRSLRTNYSLGLSDVLLKIDEIRFNRFFSRNRLNHWILRRVSCWTGIFTNFLNLRISNSTRKWNENFLKSILSSKFWLKFDFDCIWLKCLFMILFITLNLFSCRPSKNWENAIQNERRRSKNLKVEDFDRIGEPFNSFTITDSYSVDYLSIFHDLSFYSILSFPSMSILLSILPVLLILLIINFADFTDFYKLLNCQYCRRFWSS